MSALAVWLQTARGNMSKAALVCQTICLPVTALNTSVLRCLQAKIVTLTTDILDQAKPPLTHPACKLWTKQDRYWHTQLTNWGAKQKLPLTDLNYKFYIKPTEHFETKPHFEVFTFSCSLRMTSLLWIPCILATVAISSSLQISSKQNLRINHRNDEIT